MLQAQVQALYSVLHLLRTFGVDFRQPYAIFLSTPKFRLTFQRSARKALGACRINILLYMFLLIHSLCWDPALS